MFDFEVHLVTLLSIFILHPHHKIPLTNNGMRNFNPKNCIDEIIAIGQLNLAIGIYVVPGFSVRSN